MLAERFFIKSALDFHLLFFIRSQIDFSREMKQGNEDAPNKVWNPTQSKGGLWRKIKPSEANSKGVDERKEDDFRLFFGLIDF